jgi:hypothetical protein
MHLATLLLAAAEGTAESETAETPFYIIGGLLAAFAVIAAAIGLMRPNLASGPASALAGIGAVLVAATMITVLVVS